MASLAGRGRERFYVREYERDEKKGGERVEIDKDYSFTAISEIGKKRKPAGNERVESNVNVEVELGAEQTVNGEFEVEEKIELLLVESREKDNSGDDVTSN